MYVVGATRGHDGAPGTRGFKRGMHSLETFEQRECEGKEGVRGLTKKKLDTIPPQTSMTKKILRYRSITTGSLIVQSGPAPPLA